MGADAHDPEAAPAASFVAGAPIFETIIGSVNATVPAPGLAGGPGADMR